MIGLISRSATALGLGFLEWILIRAFRTHGEREGVHISSIHLVISNRKHRVQIHPEYTNIDLPELGQLLEFWKQVSWKVSWCTQWRESSKWQGVRNRRRYLDPRPLVLEQCLCQHQMDPVEERPPRIKAYDRQVTNNLVPHFTHTLNNEEINVRLVGYKLGNWFENQMIRKGSSFP